MNEQNFSQLTGGLEQNSLIPRTCCPRPECPGKLLNPEFRHTVRFGNYFRKSDSHSLARFLCLNCRRTFSQATSSVFFGHRHRRLHGTIRSLLCSGVTMRRTTRLVGVTPDCVARKLKALAAEARIEQAQWLDQFRRSEEGTSLVQKIEEAQFDELETIEHSKLKPVSIALVVERKTRKIIGICASQMAPKGVHAKKALKKYGPRRGKNRKAMRDLFSRISSCFGNSPILHSDSKTWYHSEVKRAWSGAVHVQSISRKACIVGQGELKSGGFDPLFAINHSCAMLRANISRLVRRTWATTKKIESLNDHLCLYAWVHNQSLTLPWVSSG